MEEKSIIDDLCVEGSVTEVNPGDDHFFVIKMLDAVMSQADDDAIRTVLESVDNQDLSLAMIPLGGKARRALFDNMSSRLSAMIVEDMSFMGSVRLSAAGEACERVFAAFLRLLRDNEIRYEEGSLIRDMADIFIIDQEGKPVVAARKPE